MAISVQLHLVYINNRSRFLTQFTLNLGQSLMHVPSVNKGLTESSTYFPRLGALGNQ